MRIEASAYRRRRMSMTSLIDVIFLLLLFFMLSSTFSRYAELPIGAAGGAGAGSERPDIFVTLDAEGIRINGETVGIDGISGRLTTLKEAGAQSAAIISREGATSQTLIDLLERFRTSGITAALAR